MLFKNNTNMLLGTCSSPKALAVLQYKQQHNNSSSNWIIYETTLEYLICQKLFSTVDTRCSSFHFFPTIITVHPHPDKSEPLQPTLQMGSLLNKSTSSAFIASNSVTNRKKKHFVFLIVGSIKTKTHHHFQSVKPWTRVDLLWYTQFNKNIK